MNKCYFFCFLTVVSHSIFAQSLSVSSADTVLCRGKVGRLSLLATGTFNQGNVFQVQLSDSLGSFVKPTELTRFFNPAFQNISFVLPDTTHIGNKYRVRVVSTNPVIVSNNNGKNISVISNCKKPILPIITLQSLASNLICTPATATINWTITGGTFATTNALTVQLSDSSGSFYNPLNLAVASANATTQSISIPDGFTEGIKYRIRIIAADSSIISNTNGANIAIRTKPKPSILITPSNACLGDTVKLIANDGGLGGSTFLWSGLGTGTNSTLIIAKAGVVQVGNYVVQVAKNGCSASASKELVLSNCKPDWSWALADTFWTSTFAYPSTIVDTEIDADNNLYIAGFFSQQMNLGTTSLVPIIGNNAFCENVEKRTGFLAKVEANGQLSWYRKWNASAETGDYQYCDLTINNGQIFIVSEFNSTSFCSSTPRNHASLVIVDEEDFSLGSLVGYCRYAIPSTNPTQYNYRYKGRFVWAAKFDLSGNLDVLSNLTELKTCSSSPANFDAMPTYGLGTKGYYSLKSRNNKLWILYTWNQGLPNIIRFTNGNQYSNEAAGLVMAELNPANLSIIKFEKMTVNSASGALGLSNLDIDFQNNVIISGSSASTGIGTAQQVVFGTNQLNFSDADYFAAKYNTTTNAWLWAKKSQLDQINSNASAAPNIKIDAQNNIYLGFSYKPVSGATFAGLTFPTTPNGFDGNQTAALLKINANGNAQWVKLNNHRLQEGRNALGIDFQDNIYFTSYLNNSATSEYFLIDNHRLQQKDLTTTTNTSGTPFVAIYKPSGALVGSVNNIKVYEALAFNGLVIDGNKNIIFSGQNAGKATFGQLNLKTNYGTPSNALDNRKRAFMTKIASPESITLDSASNKVCTGLPAQIKFYTAGNFANGRSFKVQLIGNSGGFQGKVIEIANGTSSPITFTAPDSLAENSFFVRVLTADNKIVGTYRTDNTLLINGTPKPVILSNTLGYVANQNLCSSSLSGYRIQGWGGTQGILKYNGNTIYTGSNIDFQPTPQQSGIYNVHWILNGCTGISSDLNLKISNPATAQLAGNQTVSTTGLPVYLSLSLSGGGNYTVNIAGIPSPLTLSNSSEIITVSPTENTVYTLTSVSNICGTGTVSGLANVKICLSSILLKNPTDNYSTGTILKETNSSNGEIIATNRLSNKAKVVYNSGRSIILNPGFSTTDSVSFKAEIKGCKLVATSVDQGFKLGYQAIYGSTDKVISEMTDFANKGATLFEPTIRLEEVFKSLSQFNETDPTLLNQYWAKFDRIINHANNIYDFVTLRVAVDYDDSRYYFQERDESVPNQQTYSTFGNALFDLFGGEISQDQFGNPSRIGYGSGHGSFASISAKAKMKGFVQKIMDRYYPILGEKIYWVSVVSSGQFETGSNYENAWNGSNFLSPRPCEYDYTPANVGQFKNWLVTERYPNLAAVNAAHGTNYSTQSQIQAPKVNVTTLDAMTGTNVRAMYNSVLFEDWYKFNYKQMKAFLLECKTVVKAKSTAIKFCFEAGSNSDQLSVARKTLNIPDINTYADVLKTTFQTSTFAGTKTWDADIVRSNFTGEIETEINESDVVNMGGTTNLGIVKQKMIDYSKIAYLNHAKAIVFVADKATPYYNNSLDALAEFKLWVENHTEQLTEGQTINVNLSQMIKNFSAALAPFNALSPSLPTNGYQNRPKIIINPDN